MLIQDAIGKYVRAVNESYDDNNGNRVGFQIIGTLESDEETGRLYVRAGEDCRGHGCIGLAFRVHNVLDVYTAPSGVIEVALKG